MFSIFEFALDRYQRQVRQAVRVFIGVMNGEL
jgi:hypothetical protein